MRTVKWKLPFNSMEYLLSLTEELAQNPMIVLITAIQDSQGNIDSCAITIRENQNMDGNILAVGAIIGAHAVTYSMTQPIVENCNLEENCICKEQQEECFDTVVSKKQEVEEDLFEEAEKQEEEVFVDIDSLEDSEAKKLLRGVLSNFKKN